MSPEKFTTNNLSIMLKIAIICLVLSELVSCENQNLTFADIEQLMVTFNESSDYIEREIKGGNGNAAIVIGTSRSGKSTLVNYLMGNNLTAYKHNSKIFIEKSDNTSYGPIIGEGSVSVTKNCKSFNSTLFPGLSIWDAAGFQDNRGSVTDIENAFYLYHLVKKAEFLKIILVSYYNDFCGDNINSFTNLLKMIESLFLSKFNEFYPSISLVMSRVPPKIGTQPADFDYINYILHTNFLNNADAMNISKPIQGFVNYLLHHNENIAIFKKILKKGIVTSDIDLNIIDSIKNTYRIKKFCRENVGFTFSDRTINSLYSIKNKIEGKVNNFASHLKELLPQFFNESLGQVKNERNNTAALEDIKRKLNDMKEHLNSSFNNFNVEGQMEAIKKFDNFRKYIEIEEEEDFLNKIRLLKFIYFLMSQAEERFISFKAVVTNAQSNILQLICYCLLLQKELEAEEYQRQINLIRESYNAVIEHLQSIQSLSESTTNDPFWEEFWIKFPLATIKNETVLSYF